MIKLRETDEVRHPVRHIYGKTSDDCDMKKHKEYLDNSRAKLKKFLGQAVK